MYVTRNDLEKYYVPPPYLTWGREGRGGGYAQTNE